MPPTTHRRADSTHLRPGAAARPAALGASIPPTRGLTHTRPWSRDPRTVDERAAGRQLRDAVGLVDAMEIVDLVGHGTDHILDAIDLDAIDLDAHIVDAIDLGHGDLLDEPLPPTVPSPVLLVSTLADDGLAARLRAASVEVVRFDDPVRTPTAIDLHEPGLVVLHLETTGVEALRACRIAAEASTTPVVVVSSTMSETQRSVAVMLGVREVIDGAIHPDALVAELAMLARRHCARRSATSRRLAVGNAVLDLGRRRLLAGGRPVALTRTEMELLRALASRPDVVCSRTDLIREVWGPDWVGAPKVLDTHIAHLRAKLAGCRSGATISTVRGVGYYLDGEEPASAIS